MRHRRAVFAVVACTLLGAAACSHRPAAGTAATTPPAAAPAPSAAPASAPAAAEPGTRFGHTTAAGRPGSTLTGPLGRTRPGTATLSAQGYGPYRIGAGPAQLASLTGPVTAGADGCATATGTARYLSPALVFAGGRLQAVTLTDPAVVTGRGVTVGTPMETVERLYPDGRQLDNWIGATAWFAPSGPDALLFRTKDGVVGGVSAGAAQPLRYKFTDDQGC
jgi:hypothetical protein